MKKLSDYKGEEAIDLLADIMEPLALILADSEIQKLVKSRSPYIKYVKVALKNHKKEVIEILAMIEGVPFEEYVKTVTFLTLPTHVMAVINDPQMKSLFTLQGQKMESTSSGPASEGTTDHEE